MNIGPTTLLYPLQLPGLRNTVSAPVQYLLYIISEKSIPVYYGACSYED